MQSKSAVDKRLVSALKPYEKLQADSAPTRNRHWVAALLRVMEDMQAPRGSSHTRSCEAAARSVCSRSRLAQVPELLALKKKDKSILMQIGESSGQEKERRTTPSQATAQESELMEVDG